MTALEHDRTLAELVTATPAAARVLEGFGLDYCCGGARSVADACRTSGVDPDAVFAALARLDAAPPSDWAELAPAELVDHIEATHHAYLHQELPRLAALVTKVVGVHGGRHPELDAIAETFGELQADLEPHLLKEERVLFPMIRALAGPGPAPVAHCGTVANPVAVMTAEHEVVGELLTRMRTLTNGYTAPADGCASYRALFDGLAELEADTHLHVHKENNVLFPAVLAPGSAAVTQ
jgi:regulator of cell morphogenesis and NO signaling